MTKHICANFFSGFKRKHLFIATCIEKQCTQRQPLNLIATQLYKKFLMGLTQALQLKLWPFFMTLAQAKVVNKLQYSAWCQIESKSLIYFVINVHCKEVLEPHIIQFYNFNWTWKNAERIFERVLWQS